MKSSPLKTLLLKTFLSLSLALILFLAGSTFTACNNDVSYKISFYVQDALYETCILKNNKITFPKEPQKDGYTFEGWYLDKHIWKKPFNENYLKTTKIENNTTVFAKLDAIPYYNCPIITFYDGSQIIESRYSYGNETITLPQLNKSENYVFEGWFLDKDVWEQPFDENAYKDTALTENINVYAKTTFYSSDLEYEFIEDGSYYTVTGLGEDCLDENILIPNFYNNYPVKKISEAAFYETNIKNVRISDNVETIERWAFGRCANLETFYASTYSKLHTFGDLTFNICPNLWSVTIPKNITKLPRYFVAQCTNIKTVDFYAPENIIEFGDYAFFKTSIEKINNFVNLEYIGEHCFSDCKSFVEFTIPTSLKRIGVSAFNETRKLKVELKDIGAWCNVILDGYFSVPWTYGTPYCNGEVLKEIIIPEGVKQIHPFAFNGATKVESITIPESVEIISTSSFSDILKLKTLNYNAKNCTINFVSDTGHHYYPFEHTGAYSLTSGAPGTTYPRHITLNVGKNVESIPSNLFNYASSAYVVHIKTINFLGETTPTLGENWLGSATPIEEIYVPENSLDNYITALGTKWSEYIVKDTEN